LEINNKRNCNENTVTLIDKSKTVGSIVNEEKTKIIELLKDDQKIFVVKRLVFEKVDQFKNLELPLREIMTEVPK